MKITNKYGLPETFMNILARPTYNKGGAHLSVTEIISSPRIVQLKRRHWDDLEEDVSDKLFAMLGTAMHNMLEHGKADNHIIEQRLHANVEGWDISGAIDLQIVEPDGVIVQDYKTTGSWAVMNPKIDWEQQLNIYAYLVERVKSTPVKAVQITAIIRDHNKRDAKNKEGYPKAPFKVIDIPLWTYEQRENFIKERIRLHSDAHFAAETNDTLPLCTPEEMWEKATSYAVRKVGNKRATAVCETQDQAEAKVEELGKGYEIEVRPGERTRCAEYCQVRDFCSQWKEYNNGN
jgi:hypothetical protein